MEVAFTYPNLRRRAHAIHVKPDAALADRVLQDLDGGVDGLFQAHVLAGHDVLVEGLLCPDDVGDVRDPVPDPFDGLHQLRLHLSEVVGEGEQKRHRLAALGIVSQVVDPVVLVRLQGVDQRLKTADRPAPLQVFVEGSDADGHAVDCVPDVVEHRLDDLQPPLGECAGQRFMGTHLLGHVAKHHHGALDGVGRVLQGPSAGVEIDPVGDLRVAHEYLHVIRCLALQGAPERKLIGGEGGLSVRMIKPKDRRIIGKVRHHEVLDIKGRYDFGEPFRRGVDNEVVALGIDGHHPVADALENGFHETGLALQPLYRLPQLGLRPLGGRDVAEHGHASPEFAGIVQKRSGTGVDVDAFRFGRIAQDHFLVIR